jgi:hypothetical protein
MRNPKIHALHVRGMLGIASDAQAHSIESCYVLRVSYVGPPWYDWLILRDLLILSGEEIESMMPNSECMCAIRLTLQPIAAKYFDVRPLLPVNWRSEHMLWLMWWEVSLCQPLRSRMQTAGY